MTAGSQVREVLVYFRVFNLSLHYIYILVHRSIKAASLVMVICPAVCLLAHFPCVKHQERFQKPTRTIRPRTATSTFTQLLSSDFCSFSVALGPERPSGLLGTRTATSIFTRACVRAYVYLFRSVVETCNMAPAWLQLSMYL